MRLLAPLLVVSTVVLFGTGVALLTLGPQHHRDLILGLHKASFIAWLVVTGIHVLVYAPRLPRAVLAPHAWSRIGLVAASLAAGAVLAGGAYSLAAPWLHHRGRDDRHESVTASVFA